jgi:fructose/tagatose bisphosphate aldolase
MINSSLLIFEIARVELAWAGISLNEYSACILGAAIAEGYVGPVFLQGDHFQISPKLPLQAEIKAIKQLILQAIHAGFYNIDIDTSTLVDLSKESTDDQQCVNAQVSADLAAFVRQVQPKGITISIGGEIGEVGGHVSTVEELNSYLTQFNKSFSLTCPGQTGLSKVSIHSGTTHGGIVLPDGSIARPTIDFDAIRQLSEIGQKIYKLGGVVQHGASTLLVEDFGQLVINGTLEVHLATAFMTSMYQHLPVSLQYQIHNWLSESYLHERTSNMTDSQFFHKVEMYALAPFKQALWNLTQDEKEVITKNWESQFEQIFLKLGCSNSHLIVAKYVNPVIINPIFDPSKVNKELVQTNFELSG